MTSETQENLARRFEAERGRLRAIASRMLGTSAEADDAVQQTWLRLHRLDVASLRDLSAWSTTTISRICLDMLRLRRGRGEILRGVVNLAEHVSPGSDPEDAAIEGEEMRMALGVLMHALAPAERVAFVLHDIFELPFGEIAGILGHSESSTRQLASRGRRRVRGVSASSLEDTSVARNVVDDYLSATSSNDLPRLLSILDPEIVLRLDAAASPGGRPVEITGAQKVARSATAYPDRARRSFPLLIDGHMGIAVAGPTGELAGVLRLTLLRGRVIGIDIVAEPLRLRSLDLALAQSDIRYAKARPGTR